MLVKHEGLRALTRAIVAASGSRDHEPALVADNLVESNLAGHDSHGVISVIKYTRHVLAGVLKPNQHVSVDRDEGPLAVLEGHAGYGQVIGREAMEFGIARARAHGVAVIAIRNSSHLGRIGAWGEQCAAAGLVSMHHVNVVGITAKVAPFRGSDARFATNPYCCALPGADGADPVVLDMATSIVAGGKVRVAYHRGEQMPEGMLIDHRGQPTTDPKVLEEEPFGALRTIAQHKGYGLALVNELLAGVLSGGHTLRTETSHPPHYPVLNNMLSVIIDPMRLVGGAYYGAEMGEALAWVRASPPADPALPVLVPGEPERLARAQRAKDGIPVPDETWRQIMATAGSVGITPGEALRLAGAVD